ncbi:YtzH-like family protein [Halalkalibacter hemicellulosilyticus]|uniref:Uncharacterized protein n=1 Tax=Halalkalibacter hemicellulosilyticusJCM 9152 TaxID=1236971 RepID=W4QJW3_9BACI|nr:YtzH-like family protein [Halalkalibacter hemicellulosilyticus]GAE32376.1 hypothetical protein JCM9152_3910 [Halalkalibacter hemicellulosilyticusJCM 9152]
MPITSQTKLQLLKDLLQNQANEHYMTTDEAAQIERLVSSLSNDTSLEPELRATLSSIKQLHTLNHQPFPDEEVSQWMNSLNIE